MAGSCAKAQKIGINKAAVAELDMKVDITKQRIPEPMIKARIDQVSNGIEPTICLDIVMPLGPILPSKPTPKAKPPATSQSTSQSIFAKSFFSNTPVMQNTANGISATTFAFTPSNSLPNTHNRMVTAKVT